MRFTPTLSTVVTHFQKPARRRLDSNQRYRRWEPAPWTTWQRRRLSKLRTWMVLKQNLSFPLEPRGIWLSKQGPPRAGLFIFQIDSTTSIFSGNHLSDRGPIFGGNTTNKRKKQQKNAYKGLILKPLILSLRFRT